MTKKDYIKIADAIKENNDLSSFISSLCQVFKNDNPSFDEVRFGEYLAGGNGYEWKK